MNRRALLRGLAPAVGGLCAGCTGNGAERTGNGAATDTATPPSPSPEYGVVDRSFTVLASDCGTQTSAVEASLDPSPPAPNAEDHVLTVTGVITGADSCHTARLATLDPGEPGGTMSVGVETYVASSDADAVCLKCLVAIEYELVVTTAGGRPGAVVVTHDGEGASRIALPE